MSLLTPGQPQPKLLWEQPSQLQPVWVHWSLIQTSIGIDHPASQTAGLQRDTTWAVFLFLQSCGSQSTGPGCPRWGGSGRAG